MKSVERHDLKISDRAIERNIRTYNRGLEAITGRDPVAGRSLARAVDFGRGLAEVAASRSPRDELIVTGLRAAARAGAQLFVAAGAAEPRQLLLWDGRKRTVEPFAAGEDTSIIEWMRAFYAALALGDVYASERLAEVDMAVLRKAPGTEEFSYLHVEALCAFHRRAPETGEKLVAAMEAADPAKVHPAVKDFVLDVAVPEIDLAFRIACGDAGRFNEALAKALECHKHMAERSEAPSRFSLALGPLGLARFALDGGLPVEVESDYIPRWILERPADTPRYDAG